MISFFLNFVQLWSQLKIYQNSYAVFCFYQAQIVVSIIQYYE